MKLFLTLLFFLNLSACSSSSSIVYYNRFDFSQVKNYSFYSSDSDFFESQNLNYAQRSRIELAIEKKLAELSFNYSEFEQADIIVSYYIVDKARQDYQAYNKTVRFCSYCLKSNLWVKERSNWQPYLGGLIIDLIDPKNNRSVWRGIYPLNTNIKDNSNELNNKLIEAVDSMLTHYPNE